MPRTVISSCIKHQSTKNNTPRTHSEHPRSELRAICKAALPPLNHTDHHNIILGLRKGNKHKPPKMRMCVVVCCCVLLCVVVVVLLWLCCCGCVVVAVAVVVVVVVVVVVGLVVVGCCCCFGDCLMDVNDSQSLRLTYRSSSLV